MLFLPTLLKTGPLVEDLCAAPMKDPACAGRLRGQSQSRLVIGQALCYI